ncbi:hypothetical protein [Rhizobium ruizarguesonis]|uniref:hypothetical protein n=1 Tax=Rhizobium ruizarguesonis TaxID=2081791 RepID=UPI001446CB1D|nr:hypothetical protein [Rhizobium ruizarguesonis]NKQ84366.1 hypothetical protein [Rhizobium ruizarguesonis]
MVGQPLVVKLIFFTCFGTFAVSFAVAFWVIIRVLFETDCLVDKPEDQGLSWRERQARKRSRFDRYYVAEEFRSLRKAAAIVQTGCALSFGSFILLGLLFGERASH